MSHRSWIRGAVLGALVLALPVMFGARPCAQWVCTTSSPVFSRAGAIELTDPTQTGRLLRDGIASTCTPDSASLFTSVDARHYDIFPSFLNQTGYDVCVTIDVDATGCGGSLIYVAAYSPVFNPADPSQNVIGESGSSPVPTVSFQIFAPNNTGWAVVFSEVNPNTLCPAFAWTYHFRRCRQPGFDVNSDMKGDATVFRPSNGVWYSLDSGGGSYVAAQFGVSSDVLTPGTYTNSTLLAATNLSVWRPGALATWFSLTPGGGLVAQPFGTTGDIPVPSDFDADGRVDYTVFRPSTGVWWSQLSTTSAVLGQPFGQNGDVPFAGDVDGDFITDYGIVRQVAGSWQWWILRSRTQTVLAMTFGFSTDKPVAADYDGDRRTDIAVWRPSNGFWYYIRSSDSVFTGFPFGGGADVPQPSDRDGDGKADFVVFRESPTPGQTIWYSWLSATGTLKSEPWGQIADVPALAHNRIH